MANYNGTPLVLGTVAALAVAASLGRRGSRAGPAVSDLKREWQNPMLPMLSDDLYRKISKDLGGLGWSEKFIADRLAAGDPHEDVTFVAYLDILAAALDSQPVGNGWYAYGESPFRPGVSVMRSESEWRIYATPGWEGEWRTLPISISQDDADGYWGVDVPLFRKTLAGEKYLFNGDLAHDIQVWRDLVRPWTEAIDSSKIGTMLAHHGVLRGGRTADELNEIAP